MFERISWSLKKARWSEDPGRGLRYGQLIEKEGNAMVVTTDRVEHNKLLSNLEQAEKNDGSE